MNVKLEFRKSIIALALAAGGALQPVGAAIVTSGLFNPDPSSGTVDGTLKIGAYGAGAVTVDNGSLLTMTRNGLQTTATGLLRVGGSNLQGTLDIASGGRVRIDGNAALNLPVNSDLFAGVNIGNGGATSSGVVRVDGAGSRLEVVGPLGFINVGDLAGSSGLLQVTNGGLVTGVGLNGLPFMNIGRDGGTGTLTVSGTASALMLSGSNPIPVSASYPAGLAGANLNVGNNTTGAAGTGTVNVTNGGHIEINTQGLALTNPNGLTGMKIGIGAVSSGTLNINGASSSFAILAGSGLAPYIAVGRDGATGVINVTGGGKLSVDTAVPAATPAAAGYSTFDIGRRVSGAGASVGTVTVSGAGSELALTGSADRLLQVGRGNGAMGTLNVSDGGLVHSELIYVGRETGANGVLNMDNGRLVIDGVLNSTGLGGGLFIGAAGGVGTANIGKHSTVDISSTASSAGLAVGGTGPQPGGTGTVNISGESTVTVTGPQAYVAVGRSGTAASTGIGTLILSDIGSKLSAIGVGARVLVGAAADTIGTLVVGLGTSLNSAWLIGVAHNGADNTGGVGTLIVNGEANAASLIIGSTGYLGGSGTINAAVTNHGTINPGNSPGTLRINGAFDNSGGKLVLEIKKLADGTYVHDELVFGSPGDVKMGNGLVEFVFDDGTDPNAFLASGMFKLATFFKEIDGVNVVDLPTADLGWFAHSSFGATSDSYNITSFSFLPVGGATLTASAIPLPPSITLVLAGLFALRLTRRSGKGQASAEPATTVVC